LQRIIQQVAHVLLTVLSTGLLQAWQYTVGLPREALHSDKQYLDHERHQQSVDLSDAP